MNILILEKRRETKKLKQTMFLSLCCIFTLLTFLIAFLFVCLATSFVALGTKMRQCYLLSKNVPSVNKTPPLSCDKEPGTILFKSFTQCVLRCILLLMSLQGSC